MSSDLLLGIADRQSVLECLDGVQDNFRQLVERWNDRLAFETCNIAEQYLNNRLALVLDVKLGTGRHPYHMYYAIRSNDSRAVLHRDAATPGRHFKVCIEMQQL